MEERENSEEILDQSKIKKPSGQTPNPVTTSLMSKRVNGSSLLAFLTCNSFLSFRLLSLPVCSSPYEMYYSSGISNILGYPMQSRIHLHSLMQCPIARILLQHLDSEGFLNLEEDSTTSSFQYPSQL